MQDHLGVQKGLREELRQWKLVRCDQRDRECNGVCSGAGR